MGVALGSQVHVSSYSGKK
ncbi:hypothetical protein RSOL_038770 [Rhizoctonia solani AG-3 Rhs1AP]|uniref:Uncharacterized protein n=1 Tax=Rhizoctonia solani AG-3 Rhs1AP TaxID=1086054 RepID=X8IW13_9AGAM|nr:hypothetical protein RSOL_038770 [Rhizoctonia solani AG-3 Rhs1AP]